MFKIIQRIIKDCFTGIDGLSYDPARVIGYGASVIGVLVFMTDCILRLAYDHVLDAQSFALEFGALMAGIAGAGVGVAIKSKTEPEA